MFNLGIIIAHFPLMTILYRHFFLFLCLGLLLSITQANSAMDQTRTDGYVHWNDKKLDWTDFQGEIPGNSEFHALTHSAINLEYEGEGVIMEFKIESIFDPIKSWKKEGVDAYILYHEQVHFDITEYHARLLRKQLKTTKYSSFKLIETEIKKMFNDTFSQANKMQLAYDEQTAHSVNNKKQSKWNKKLKKLLRSTENFKNPKLKVNVSYLTE
jgi:Bacterial protein of unknown function (DUF922)